MMTETTQSPINIEQLMSEIRDAVAKREAEGRVSFLGAAREVYNLLSAPSEQSIKQTAARVIDLQSVETHLDPLQLQPTFVRKDHYHVKDLLQFHDETFIWNAYRALLNREPDEPGLRQYLDNLRSGRFNKIDILAKIRFSIEGRNNGVRIDGLAWPAFLRRLYRIPVLGYLLEMVVGIARLPAWIRSQRQFEAHALAQLDRLASHVNQLGPNLSRGLSKLSSLEHALSESFSRNLLGFAEEQGKITRLQHQQMMALYRQQQRIAENSEKGLPAGVPTPPNGGRFDELVAAYIDQFRGSREKIKQGLKFYLPFVAAADISGDILDLGCGRGEWLELLKEDQRNAQGVESNPLLARQAQSRGLQVIEGNALVYMRGLPDESLEAVTGFHFIEHLLFETLIELLDEIKRTLRPGGLLIFETPNPKNLTVAACNFYADPTHRQPVFPETLEFVLKEKGFENVTLEYLNPVEGSPFRNGTEGSEELDSWFFGPRDFAIIASKSGRETRRAKVTVDEELVDTIRMPESGQSTLQVAIENEIVTLRIAQFVSKSGHEYYARPESDDSRIFEDVVDLDEYSLPSKFNEQDVVIDIGSHIGSFSYAVFTRGAGKVYAYEAHPANHAITCKNLERFGDRAICRNLAVWRSDVGRQTLFNDRVDSLSSGNTGGHAVVYNEVGLPIQTVGLDDIIFEASDGFKRKIRLLKIDCEGAEYPILFTTTHLDYIEEICGEYHVVDPRIMPERAKVKGMAEEFDGHALKKFLEAAGWSVRIEPTAQQTQLGQFRATRR
jgi:FkbM family methyltransferase